MKWDTYFMRELTINRLYASFFLRALFAVIFLGGVAVLPASAQMGGYTTYSDTWLWSPAPTNNSPALQGNEAVEALGQPAVYVVGVALTQENYYNSYGHTYYATTTVRGPGGRSVTASASGTYPYARATAQVRLDFNLPGDFFADGDHRVHCPYAFGTIFFTTTSSTLIVGVSLACYELLSFNPATQIATLVRKVPCNTRCGSAEDRLTFRYSGSPPQRLVVGEPYARERLTGIVVCSHVTAIRRTATCDCGNVETNIPPVLF